MLDIDTFWRELFPMFQEYEFLYIFLDIATIIAFIRIIFNLPGAMLLRSKKLWKDCFI